VEDDGEGVGEREAPHLEGDRGRVLRIEECAGEELVGPAVVLGHLVWKGSLDRGTGLIDSSAKDLQPFFAMKIIYKPFGIVFGLLAGMLARSVFEFLWSKIDQEDPPKATDQNASWPKVLGAAAVEGVSFKVTRAAVDRAGAIGFDYLTGVWPGAKVPDE
jgi:hypothetical protein